MSCIHKILKFTNKNVNIFDISWISIWVSTAHPGPSWSHGHLICNYLCNLCLSQTNIGSSNPVHGMVNSIQHYVIKFVSDVCHVGCFLRFAPLIKPTANHVNVLWFYLFPKSIKWFNFRIIRPWCKLFRKHVSCTTLDIYLFMHDISNIWM